MWSDEMTGVAVPLLPDDADEAGVKPSHRDRITPTLRLGLLL
jgi:hypothetical protein